VEEYDPVTDTWTRKADMPTARLSHSASVVNEKIYVIGGWNLGVVFSTVEEYDTGFVSLSDVSPVSPQGKLTATWGEIKRSR